MLQFKTLLLPLPAKSPLSRKPTVRSSSVKAWLSPIETRFALITALATQAASVYQRSLIDASKTVAQLVLPPDARSLEEALMTVPDLESVDYKVIAREDEYEIREVLPYYVAETTMPGNTGFDFVGSSQSFNAIAAYLFGKNERAEEMEMTSPVYIRKADRSGEKMEMTTPVVTKKIEEGKWSMAFIMPAKYGGDLPLPKDSSVKIVQIPPRIVAVVAFSGFVTDSDVRRRELRLQRALQKNVSFKVKDGASVEVAQYNPPFTLPFRRRNEIALEVVRNESVINLLPN